MVTKIHDFDRLVAVFRSKGYAPKVITDKKYLSFCINTDKLKVFCGALLDEDDKYCLNQYISDRICIDREECFDKMSKCPICLPIPENIKQIDFLFDKIDWLLTDEGLKASNDYDIDKWVLKYEEQ